MEDIAREGKERGNYCCVFLLGRVCSSVIIFLYGTHTNLFLFRKDTKMKKGATIGEFLQRAIDVSYFVILSF
jgi:hypothetical protein